MKIKSNPEFQRYLWLNFSLVKIVMVPIVMFLLALLFTEFDIINDPTGEWAKDLFTPLIMAYYGMVFIIGNYESANAYPKEIANKTWDFQRMSSLSAWQLVTGKVFGSTSYTWYVGFVLLAALGGVMTLSSDFSLLSATDIFYFVMLIIWAGIIGHITSFICSINLGAMAGFLAGLAVSQIILSTTDVFDFELSLFSNDNVNWFRHTIDSVWFLYTSLLFFGFWLLTGSVHMIRSCMRFSNMPFAWIGFTITVNLYIIGFLLNGTIGKEKYIIQSIMLFMGTMMMGWTYLSVFLEASELQKYKRFIYGFHEKNLSKILENTPRWSITFLIAIVCFIVVIYYGFVNDEKKSLQFSVFILSACLFVVRDGLVLHIFALGKKLKYTSLGIVSYYILIYGVLPGLIIVGNSEGAVYSFINSIYDEGSKNIALALFYPRFDDNILIAIFPVLIQCVFCAYILRWRLKTMDG